MKNEITLNDIKDVLEFNKRNQVVVEPKANVEVLGTLVQINGKYYLENETIDEDGSKFKASHPVKTIVLGY